MESSNHAPVITNTDENSNSVGPRPCLHCGGPLPSRKPRREQPKFCCHRCASEFKTGKPAPGFTTPPSDKAARVRAHGIVNKRLKLGWFAPPDRCMKCDSGDRVVSHHENYQKPDHVHWICYGCHQRVHHEPDYLAGIAPFVCYDRRESKPEPHGRGGWRGDRTTEYKNARCSLSLEQGDELRRRYKQGERQADLAAAFGVSQMTVSRVVRGERCTPSPLARPERTAKC